VRELSISQLGNGDNVMTSYNVAELKTLKGFEAISMQHLRSQLFNCCQVSSPKSEFNCCQADFPLIGYFKVQWNYDEYVFILVVHDAVTLYQCML
jgi:hypothetical protein